MVVGRLGDAERGGGVGAPEVRKRSSSGLRVGTRREAVPQAVVGHPHVLERHRARVGRPHAERVPVVVEHDAGGARRHQREAVALVADRVAVGDRDVDDRRRRRHGGEDLRPSISQPSSTRVAVVEGRVRSCGEGSLTALAKTTPAWVTSRMRSSIAAARAR